MNTPTMSTRRFFAVALVVSLLVAGVASYYASSHPDGLEYVAEQTGFIDSAEDSATADSPLADYQTSGVDDARISGGLAGVIGVVVMLVLSTGLFWLVRRRGTGDSDDSDSASDDAQRQPARRSEA
jgi:cobalt/nickel transport protein